MTRLSYVGQYLKRLQCHWHREGDILFSTNQHLTSVWVGVWVCEGVCTARKEHTQGFLKVFKVS